MVTKKWVCGFVNGEGCFTFGGGNSYVPSFSITLHINDIYLLETIKKKLKCGKIYTNLAKYNSCAYQIKVKDVDSILKYFEGELYGEKKRHFENWKKGITYLKNNKDVPRFEKMNFVNKLKPNYKKKIW